MRILITSFSFIFISLILVQCDNKQSPENNETRLARVGSAYLTLNEARSKIPSFLLKQDSIQALQNYREQWVREQLLLRQAKIMQLSNQQAVQQKISNAKNDVLKNALKEVILSDFANTSSLTEQEVRTYFEQNKDQLLLPERYVKYRHLETPSLGSARKGRQELLNDVSWNEVAEKYSQNSPIKIQNARKYWPVSAVLNGLPQMKRYIATLDSGAVSPIQRYNGTYHFVQLVDAREKGEAADPDWFTGELKQWLLAEKQRKHYNSYVKNLYLQAREDNEMDVYNVLKSNTNNSDPIESNVPNE